MTILSILIIFIGCSNSDSSSSSGSSGGSTTTSTGTTKTKPTIKFYGKVIEYTSGPMMTDALVEAVKDDYIVDAIQVDWSNQDKVIRTGIASGEPCDVYNYTPSGMVNFKDMALDLKPYLDADPTWKSQFSEAALAAGTYDGKVLNVPWEQNFPTVLANKTKFDELGIKIPNTWTMEEFLRVCDQIKDAGYYPFANAMDLGRASWLYRNAIMSVVVSEGKYDDYIEGTLPLDGPESRKALEAVASLYNNDYMYPGAGAVTVKNDEVKAGFYQGKVLMMTEIAAGAKNTAKDAGFEVATAPWPSAGSVSAGHGVYNGFFIPLNAPNLEAAVEVLKVFTSASIQAIHGEQGYIPANIHVEISDPFVQEIMDQGATVQSGTYPYSIKQIDYYSNMLMPDLILNGGVGQVLTNLEKLK